jgi:hypothetical protein
MIKMSEEVKNVAMLLTGFDTKKKPAKEIVVKDNIKEKHIEKKYGLPKGFKLIGFNIEV